MSDLARQAHLLPRFANTPVKPRPTTAAVSHERSCDDRRVSRQSVEDGFTVIALGALSRYQQMSRALECVIERLMPNHLHLLGLDQAHGALPLGDRGRGDRKMAHARICAGAHGSSLSVTTIRYCASHFARVRWPLPCARRHPRSVTHPETANLKVASHQTFRKIEPNRQNCTSVLGRAGVGSATMMCGQSQRDRASNHVRFEARELNFSCVSASRDALVVHNAEWR